MFTIRQYAFLYSVLMGSMLGGASVVHAVLQPDLTLPPVGDDKKAGEQQRTPQSWSAKEAAPSSGRGKSEELT